MRKRKTQVEQQGQQALALLLKMVKLRADMRQQPHAIMDNVRRWDTLLDEAAALCGCSELIRERGAAQVEAAAAAPCEKCGGEGVLRMQHPNKPAGVVICEIPCLACTPVMGHRNRF